MDHGKVIEHTKISTTTCSRNAQVPGDVEFEKHFEDALMTPRDAMDLGLDVHCEKIYVDACGVWEASGMQPRVGC